MIKLADVYSNETVALDVLYRLLEQRAGKDEVNISNEGLTTWQDHVSFVLSRPYEAWYLILYDDDEAGAIYLTKNDEIGVFVFSEYQGRSCGPIAVREIMYKHPRKRYLANINPANKRSIEMFEAMGFEHIQQTYQIKVSK